MRSQFSQTYSYRGIAWIVPPDGMNVATYFERTYGLLAMTLPEVCSAPRGSVEPLQARGEVLKWPSAFDLSGRWPDRIGAGADTEPVVDL